MASGTGQPALDPAGSGRVGYCFDGALTNSMAVRQPWLAGAVPVNHRFNPDSTPRYDEVAAEIAWAHTLA